VALATGLLLPLHGTAQFVQGSRSASSNFAVSITIRPQFRVLTSKPVSGGHEYRVWTNMRKVQLNGNEYHFDRVGEATVMVPGAVLDMGTLPGIEAPQSPTQAPAASGS